MRLLLSPLSVFVLVAVVLSGGSAVAQESSPGDPAPQLATPPHAKKPRAHAKSAHREAKPAEAAPKEPAPWAAVDPGRATGQTPPPPDASEAAVPGVPHLVQPDEDRYSVGMKWNSSNAPNAGQYSTQGVINEVNHDLGAPSAVGTDAEMGLKLHF